MSELSKIRQMLADELMSICRQADKLSAAIAALDAADQGETPAPKKATTPAVKKPAAKAPKVKAPKKPAAKANGKETPLPTTSGDWFLELITKTPQSPGDIFAAAVQKAGGELSKAALGKLRSRLSFNLNDLSNRGKVVKTNGDGKKKLYALAGA